MNIYDSNGELDLDAARAAGNALPRANVDPKMQAQQIVIAALLDIAESLRPLAAEAVAAVNGVDFNFYASNPAAEVDDHPFEVGDVVYVEGIDGPGEIVSFRDTEGETFAGVYYDNGDTGERITVPLRSLHRLVGDEGDEPDPLAEVVIDTAGMTGAEIDAALGPDAEVIIEAHGAGANMAEAHEEGLRPAPDLTDELDEDFDGDAHTAAEDAVAKLAEAEAKRKAEKKKAKK